MVGLNEKVGQNTDTGHSFHSSQTSAFDYSNTIILTKSSVNTKLIADIN